MCLLTKICQIALKATSCRLYETRSSGLTRPVGCDLRLLIDFLPPVSTPPRAAYQLLAHSRRSRGSNPLRASQSMLPESQIRLSVQEQSFFCVLHHPCQSFLQIFPRDCAASEDGPLVRLDCIELQSLEMSVVLLFTVRVDYRSLLTFPISSSVMQPPTSVLLAKTRRVAPMSRYSLISTVQSIEQCRHPPPPATKIQALVCSQ